MQKSELERNFNLVEAEKLVDLMQNGQVLLLEKGTLTELPIKEIFFTTDKEGRMDVIIIDDGSLEKLNGGPYYSIKRFLLEGLEYNDNPDKVHEFYQILETLPIEHFLMTQNPGEIREPGLTQSSEKIYQCLQNEKGEDKLIPISRENFEKLLGL